MPRSTIWTSCRFDKTTSAPIWSPGGGAAGWKAGQNWPASNELCVENKQVIVNTSRKVRQICLTLSLLSGAGGRKATTALPSAGARFGDRLPPFPGWHTRSRGRLGKERAEGVKLLRARALNILHDFGETPVGCPNYRKAPPIASNSEEP